MSDPLRMLGREEWGTLKTAEAFREQLNIRRTLADQMLGRLYWHIMQDEISFLVDLWKNSDVPWDDR